MARKNGCPTSVRDWIIEIMSRVSTAEAPEWIRIKGLNSITVSNDADTEDGSSADSLYSEPYVTKRNGSISLEGRPIADRITGAHDPGQAELDYYLTVGGCDGDARLRIIDNCGHAEIWDVAVISKENGADETSETVSWDLERVGAPESEPYVQVSGVTTEPATSVSVKAGQVESVTVAFTPDNASNQKYSVASADTTKVKVENIDGLTFDIVGVAATTNPVKVQVKTMNNAKIAEIAVTVTSA